MDRKGLCALSLVGWALGIVTASLIFTQAAAAQGTFKIGYLIVTPDAADASPKVLGRFDQPPVNAFTELEATTPNLTNQVMINILNDSDLGLAIVNPNERPAMIRLQFLINPAIVAPIAPPSKQIELAPYHQTVQFLTDLFDGSMPSRIHMLAARHTAAARHRNGFMGASSYCDRCFLISSRRFFRYPWYSCFSAGSRGLL